MVIKSWGVAKKNVWSLQGPNYLNIFEHVALSENVGYIPNDSIL